MPLFFSDSFGVRGTFLIVGGIYLNCAALGLFWKTHVQKGKIETSIKRKNVDQEKNESNNVSETDIGFSNICSDICSRSNDETTTRIKDNDVYVNDTEGQVNDGYSSKGDENHHHTNDTTSRVNIIEYGKYEDDLTVNQESKQSTKAKLKHLIRNHMYILTIMGMLFSMRSLNPYIIFMLDMYRDHGYSISQGTTGLTVFNIASVLARAAPAVLVHFPFYNTYLLPICSTLMASMAMHLMTHSSSAIVLHILSGFIGCGHGVVVSVLVVTISELVQAEYLPEAIGLLMSLNGAFALVSGLVTGHLRDTSGSYVMPQIITSALTGLGSAMFIIAACLQRRKGLRLSQVKRNSKSEVTRL